MNKEQELSNLKKQQKLNNRHQFQDISKQRLKNIIKKKITTTFISALDEFERTFGQKLWGHNLPETELTDEQKENKLKWENVRKNILNRGNNQYRALMSEIELYEIEFCGYEYEMSCNRRNNCE